MNARASHDSSQKAPWAAACARYSEHIALGSESPRADYFAGFGALHVAVAQELFDRDEELNALGERRVVHLENGAGLLAVYSPAQRMVQIRAHTTALAQIARRSAIHVRVMPAAAGLLDRAAAQGFKSWPIAALYWYFGQTALSALDTVPDLATQILQIRRFPALAPSALLMRQLQLIHLIGHNSLNFEQLFANLQAPDVDYVCPDLASLYLTGTLRLSSA